MNCDMTSVTFYKMQQEGKYNISKINFERPLSIAPSIGK
jgi:hypothetical protein